MKMVFKFPLIVTGNQSVRMPVGAELLTAQTQNQQLRLWALVDPDPDVAKEYRAICIRGTGHPANDVGRYISTFQLADGALVFHVLEGAR